MQQQTNDESTSALAKADKSEPTSISPPPQCFALSELPPDVVTELAFGKRCMKATFSCQDASTNQTSFMNSTTVATNHSCKMLLAPWLVLCQSCSWVSMLRGPSQNHR